MKLKAIMSAALLFYVALAGFTYKLEIAACYLTFRGTDEFVVAQKDRLPMDSEKSWAVTTEQGEVTVSRLDGYRVLYNNKHHVPFVNLKVELSDNNLYNADQKKLIDNLSFLNSHTQGMETPNLIELNYNGFKIIGLSRNSIERGSILGTFVMFPGNGTVVYFYFNNLKPSERTFETIDEYKTQRNDFIGEYTKHLKECSDK